MMKVNVKQVVNFFLHQNSIKNKNKITALKLQKLMYYAQGCALGIFNDSLFTSHFIAERNGPICPDVDDIYKSHEVDTECTIEPGTDTYELLLSVWHMLGEYSGYELEAMSYRGRPWRNAFERGEGTIISDSDIKSYFLEIIQGTYQRKFI